jgi:type II secretory pathway component PulF
MTVSFPVSFSKGISHVTGAVLITICMVLAKKYMINVNAVTEKTSWYLRLPIMKSFFPV